MILGHFGIFKGGLDSIIQSKIRIKKLNMTKHFSVRLIKTNIIYLKKIKLLRNQTIN